MLAVEGVAGGYEDIQVLRGVDLRVAEGEIVALLGPNGHGKSTLMKAIAGVHSASAGKITFRDNDITGLAAHDIVRLGLAYIAEERHLFPEMTVLENLQLGAYVPSARANYRDNRDLVFSIFPVLEERQRQVVTTLSGGESRMVAIARGLMSGARLLLVDEPSIGLAPGMKKHMYQALRRINQDAQITILLVEQEIDYAIRLARRLYLLKKGAIAFERASEGVDVAEIREAYF